jgi:hypothetical protein
MIPGVKLSFRPSETIATEPTSDSIRLEEETAQILRDGQNLIREHSRLFRAHIPTIITTTKSSDLKERSKTKKTSKKKTVNKTSVKREKPKQVPVTIEREDHSCIPFKLLLRARMGMKKTKKSVSKKSSSSLSSETIFQDSLAELVGDEGIKFPRTEWIDRTIWKASVDDLSRRLLESYKDSQQQPARKTPTARADAIIICYLAAVDCGYPIFLNEFIQLISNPLMKIVESSKMKSWSKVVSRVFQPESPPMFQQVETRRLFWTRVIERLISERVQWSCPKGCGDSSVHNEKLHEVAVRIMNSIYFQTGSDGYVVPPKNPKYFPRTFCVQGILCVYVAIDSWSGTDTEMSSSHRPSLFFDNQGGVFQTLEYLVKNEKQRVRRRFKNQPNITKLLEKSVKTN